MKRMLARLAVLTLLLAAAAALLSCGSSGLDISPDGDIPLRYVYNQGDTWVYELTSTDTGTYDEYLLDKWEPATHTDVYVDRKTLEVLSVNDDGSAVARASFEELFATMDGEIQQLEEPTKTSLTLDTTGRVLKVSGFKALAEEFAETGDIEPVLDYLDDNYDLVAPHYPESGTARVGDEWSSDYTIELPGDNEAAKVESTFKLAEVFKEEGRWVATIEYSLEFLPFTLSVDWTQDVIDMAEAEGETMDPDEAKFIVSMNAEMSFSGKTKVDLATGLPVSGEGDYTMAGSFQVPAAPADLVPQDERGPFYLDGTGTYELRDVTSEVADGEDQEVSLRHTFKKGDTWVIEEKVAEEGTVDALLVGETGGPLSTEDTTESRHTYEVLEVDGAGAATLLLTYETLDRTMYGEPQDFSDCRPQEMRLTVDRTGRVLSFEVDPVEPDDDDQPGYRQYDQHQAVLNLAFDVVTLVYPDDGSAKVGEEWTVTWELDSPDYTEYEATVSAKITRTYEDDQGRLLAVVDYEVTTPDSKETSDLSDSFAEDLGDDWDPQEMGELVVLMTLTGELSYQGTALVDTATGRILSSQGTTDMWNEYNYTKAPQEVIPLDQRGPFGWGGTGLVSRVRME